MSSTFNRFTKRKQKKNIYIAFFSSRYTDSVMNSYPPMGVPGSASIAQFYQQAAAVSAASAGVGVDSLGSACSQLSSSVGGAQSGLPDITRHPWLVTGE